MKANEITFKVFWFDGRIEYMSGEDFSEAFYKAGYGLNDVTCLNDYVELNRESLRAQGAQAEILDCLHIFTEGPLHDWCSQEIMRVKEGLESEDKSFTTLADMAKLSSGEISGPQCRYCGNKSKNWMGWMMSQFGLAHNLTGY